MANKYSGKLAVEYKLEKVTPLGDKYFVLLVRSRRNPFSFPVLGDGLRTLPTI